MAQLEALVIGTPSSAQPSATPSQSEQGAAGVAGVYTAAEVAKHSSTTDCWSVVSGNVYDLTGYANSHPGGASAIAALCGKDATSAFSGQHGGSPRPNSTLDAFLIGSLDSTGAANLPGAQVSYGEGEGREGDD